MVDAQAPCVIVHSSSWLVVEEVNGDIDSMNLGFFFFSNNLVFSGK